MHRILAAMPVRPKLRQADVFLSYEHKDSAIVAQLAEAIERAGYSLWFDRDLIGGQSYRDVLDQRIDAAKAVVVAWTANSVSSRYVRHEAQRAGDKLICLRDPTLEFKRIPGPFAANDRIIELGKLPELLEALALKGVKPRLISSEKRPRANAPAPPSQRRYWNAPLRNSVPSPHRVCSQTR